MHWVMNPLQMKCDALFSVFSVFMISWYINSCYRISYHISWSTWVQAMACCMATLSYYRNQCWLIISKVQRHSSGTVSQEITQLSVTKISLKSTYLKFHSNFQGVDEVSRNEMPVPCKSLSNGSRKIIAPIIKCGMNLRTHLQISTVALLKFGN